MTEEDKSAAVAPSEPESQNVGDGQPIIPYAYTEHKRREKKRQARTLRTILVVANIIFWLCGCAMLSIAIWLRFTNESVKVRALKHIKCYKYIKTEYFLSS